MLTGERLLIVEEEFLIALDIQRVMESAHAARTVFARNFTEAAALADRFSEFDLAIVTPPRRGSVDQEVADRLATAGPAVVVCSAAQVSLAGELVGSEIVYKPFADEDLLTACRRALERRGRR